MEVEGAPIPAGSYWATFKWKKEDANFIPHKKALVCHGDDEHDADNGVQIEMEQYGQFMMMPPSHNGKQDKS